MNPVCTNQKRMPLMKGTIVALIVISLALAAIFAFSSESEAASGICGEKVTWSLENGKLTISGTGDMYNYEDEPTPWQKSSVTDIVVTGSPYNIGTYAFSGCTSLKSVDLGQVKQIGEGAFSGCVSLKSIVIPDSVLAIMPGAFKGDSGLSSVTFGSNLKTINDEAFSGCVSLKSVSFGDSLQKIEINAFSGNSSLSSITFGKGMEDICWEAFSGCPSLTFLSFPDSVKYIKTRAFKDSTNLNSITFGTGLMMLSPDAFPVEFEDLNGNKIVAGAANVAGHTYKYDRAGVLRESSSEAQKCGDNLTCVLEGTKLTISGSGDMYDYTTSSNRPWQRSVSEIVFSGTPTSIGKMAFSECPLKSVTIPDSVTKIGDDAFAWCNSLESVNLGSSVKIIGRYAFQECPLKSVVIPDSVTKIDSYAFQNCADLSSVTFGKSLASIEGRAFTKCPSLTSLTFPDSLVSIGDFGFDDDDSLTYVSFGKGLSSVGSNAFSVKFEDKNGKTVTAASDLKGNTYRSSGDKTLRDVNAEPAEPVHPSSVTLNKTSASLETGKTLKLTATVQPSDAADKSVTWSSSDDKVAAVDQSGNVKAVSEGKATITVTTNDGGKTASCAVTVTSAPEPSPSSGSDNTLLYAGVGIAIVVLIILALLFMRRSKL